MINAWENLHCATLELVRSTPIKQRLIAAYRHLTPIPEELLPSESRNSFTQVMQTFACVQPLRGEDPVVASVRKLSNQQADDCAALIVEIFGALCRADALAQRQPGAVSTVASIVQLRSVERTPEEFEVPALIATN
jgi:hypothetical protein